MPDPIENGTFTVVNPRTGGYRSLRVFEPDREYWKNLEEGMRIAAYYADATDKWIPFAFVEPSGFPRIWKRASLMLAEIAALKWLLTKGPGREPELRQNWREVQMGRESFEVCHPPRPRRTYEELFPEDD